MFEEEKLFNLALVAPNVLYVANFVSSLLLWWQLTKPGHQQTQWWLQLDLGIFFNTLRPRQNGRHFADDTFNHIFVNENVRISIKFSLKFVPKSPINIHPALVQIMAWHRPGNKPLSEPVMVSLLTHICVTRPQWVNTKSLWPQMISSYVHWSVDIMKNGYWDLFRSFSI